MVNFSFRIVNNGGIFKFIMNTSVRRFSKDSKLKNSKEDHHAEFLFNFFCVIVTNLSLTTASYVLAMLDEH